MKLRMILILMFLCLSVQGQNFDTEVKYPDNQGNNILIQNSFPRGGFSYTDPEGSDHVYVVFWTRITNQRDGTIEMRIDFPADRYRLIQSFDRSFRLFLPKNKMTLDKEPLFLYGLSDLESVLDEGFYSSSSIRSDIKPKDSHLFYVVALFNKGVEGVVRAGFSLKDQKLIFTINGTDIPCGEMKVKSSNSQ